MSDWSHGYDVSTEYSYGFYREMGPDWLDLCAWIGGFDPPRRQGYFRYLDLGCGHGDGDRQRLQPVICERECAQSEASKSE